VGDRDRAAGEGPPEAAPSEGGGAFDRIAREFDLHRERPWKFVVDWLEGLGTPPAGMRVVVDVGCGNGRHMVAARAKGVRCLGVDASGPMLAAAMGRLGEDAPLALGDARALPVRTGAAGAVLSIAVVHHLRSGADRAAAMREVARALAPGGRALVSVWALDLPEVREDAGAVQERPGGRDGGRDGSGGEIEGRGGPGSDPRDLLVPWDASPGARVQRYYRAVPLEELAALARAAGLQVLWAGERGQNHVVEVAAAAAAAGAVVAPVAGAAAGPPGAP
jgi:SAM-dependent methyltransferase